MNGKDNGDTNEQGNLGLWSVVSIIVGIVVGVSIFQVPDDIAKFSSDPWTCLLVWAFGGLLAVVGAFCYAELATTYPRAGGDYVYLTRAFGPWCGFLFGWAQLIVILPASIGAMAIVFAGAATPIYELQDYTGLGLSSELSYAVLAVLVFSLLNIIGVTLGKIAQNVLTAVKVLGVVAIMVAGFGWADANPLDWRFGEPGTHVGGGVAGEIGWGSLAVILVLYAYGGWNDSAFVAAEVRNPRRNIPWALLLGVGAITVLYLLINLAYLTGLGFDGIKTGDVPARLLKKTPLEENGANAMRVIMMISALGAANGLIFAGARVYATLGNDHPLFGWLGFWRPGHGAPILALIAQALITIGMIVAVATAEGHRVINEAIGWLNEGFATLNLQRLTVQTNPDWQAAGAFKALVTYTAPIFWIFFLSTGFSLFTLRTRDAALARPFPVPLYPLLPFIFCMMCVYMLYQSTIYIGWQALFAVILVLVGVPLYWLSRAIGYHGEAET
jgi:amino acid transporter